MLYPNARFSTLHRGRMFGPGLGLDSKTKTDGCLRNPFIGNRPKTNATPSGYGLRGFVAPYISGEMGGGTTIVISPSGQGIQGLVSSGNSTIAIDAIGNGSLFAFMSGNATLNIIAQGTINAVVSLIGNASVRIDAAGNPVALVSLSGNSGIRLDASAILSYTQALQGRAYFVDQTGLTAQAVTEAVWSAVATSNNNPGTMGAKLNAAGSSGDPWATILEAGLSAADILRIVLSAVAGKREGIGTAVETYYGQDGTTIRIEFAHDDKDNGTPFVDGSI